MDTGKVSGKNGYNSGRGEALSGAIAKGLEELSNPKEPDKSKKLEVIREKLRSGKKLSGDEMRLLADKDPGSYAKAQVIMSQRNQLEHMLKQARTKEEEQNALSMAMKFVDGLKDTEMVESAINQLMDAKRSASQKPGSKDRQQDNGVRQMAELLSSQANQLDQLKEDGYIRI